ncbi:MAG: Ig-like domain-containing protein, partial [Gemmatimonadales bacterium]
MQWRSALVWRLVAPAMVVLALAGCNEELGTGPRIATITVFSGNGQTGAIGALLGQPLVVEVKDQRGDPIEGGVVTWDVTSGTGIVSPRSDTTDENGLATTTFRLGSSIGVQTVSATLTGLSPVSFIANAVSAPASQLTLVDGDGQAGSVGERLSQALEVRVTDAFDNPKSDVPVNFTVISGGGTVSSQTVVSDANGMAQTTWTLGTVAGNQSVIAGSGAITPVTFTATASPDNPSGIVIVSGGGQIANPGATLPDSVVVRVVDRFGNGVPGISVDFVIVGASGSVSPTGTTSDANGRAATRWTLGTVGGPNRITAQAGSLSLNVQSAAFIVFETVNAGGISSCGIDEGGVLYCWGSNNDGALGIGAGPAGCGPIFAFPLAVSLAT